MDVGTYVRICFHVSNALVAPFCHYVIRMYHIRKPLGMQTFLGRVIVLNLRFLSSAVVLGSTALLLAEIFSPLDKVFVIIIAFPSEIMTRVDILEQ